MKRLAFADMLVRAHVATAFVNDHHLVNRIGNIGVSAKADAAARIVRGTGDQARDRRGVDRDHALRRIDDFGAFHTQRTANHLRTTRTDGSGMINSPPSSKKRWCLPMIASAYRHANTTTAPAFCAYSRSGPMTGML